MLDKIKEESKARTARLNRILGEPDFIDVVCCHIANGGSPIKLAEALDIRFSDLSNWVNKEPERRKRYNAAMMDRHEWSIERVLQELRTLGMVDIRGAYDEHGNLKPIKELPEELARAVSSIDVTEEFVTVNGKRESIGQTKKLKTVDKLKALELLGKNLRLFIERHETSTVVSYADLVLGSYKEGEPDVKTENSPESPSDVRSVQAPAADGDRESADEMATDES